MLASQTREVRHAMAVRAVAGSARGHPLLDVPVPIQRFTLGDERGVGGPTARSCGFGGVQPGERVDGVVIEGRGHPPHVGQRIRIAAGLGAECLQLGREVAGGLTRQVRKLRLLTDALRPVTGPTGGHGDASAVLLGVGRRIVRERGDGHPDAQAGENGSSEWLHGGLLATQNANQART